MRETPQLPSIAALRGYCDSAQRFARAERDAAWPALASCVGAPLECFNRPTHSLGRSAIAAGGGGDHRDQQRPEACASAADGRLEVFQNALG